MKVLKFMKSVGRVLIKICMGIVLAVILLILASTVYNFFDSKNDSAGIAQYGETVMVGEHKMNVVMEGSGDKTIVLLPGYGTAAPALDFKGLMEELKSDYRVIAVEPFGYGLSDAAEEERTIEAMNEELHTCLQELGIKNYILAGHSIAGIYGLRYIQEYGDEVTGYIGLDTSVPYQIHEGDIPTWIYPVFKTTGLYRVLMKLAPESFGLSDLSEEENRQLGKITLANLGNSNIISEGKNFKSNLSKVQELRYPDDLPVMFFLASESVDAHDFWIPEHEHMIENVAQGKIVVIDGPHYIHHGHEEEIKREIDAFFE